MSKKAIRLITLVLAIAMVATLAVGCGGSENTDKPGKTPSGSNSNVNPEDYRGTSITYVTWKDPAQNEDGPVVEKFKKEYGIDVKIQLVDQKTYVSTIASNIAAGTQGDIFFENGTFPSSLTVMQPLDAAQIDFTDPIWNQDLIKASTIDGHPYLVDTLSNVWAEVDICVYNKSLFENNGITTPADYVAQGKWTFENFRYACQQIKNVNPKTYKGACLIGETALAAAGATLFGYKDNKIVATNDKHLYEVMTELADLKADGLAGLGFEAFQDGTYGMALTNCFALKKTGYYTNFNSAHLAATYLPTWKEGEDPLVTGIYRGWGLIEGAQNPVAAGIFLREYLDVTNYDLANVFHNQEVANFFFEATGTTGNKLYYFGGGMCRIYNGDKRIHEAWAATSPTNMKSYLDGQKNVMNSMVNKANADIENERKELKKTFG